ncbi:unnamed protein product, partial [Amoebophrya sp. A25]|eukprot:GSA25T00010183001.1
MFMSYMKLTPIVEKIVLEANNYEDENTAADPGHDFQATKEQSR